MVKYVVFIHFEVILDVLFFILMLWLCGIIYLALTGYIFCDGLFLVVLSELVGIVERQRAQVTSNRYLGLFVFL